MNRVIKEFRKSKRGYPEVVVTDVRDLFYGDYAVEKLVGGDGYIMIYSSTDLNKCIEKAKQVFDKM